MKKTSGTLRFQASANLQRLIGRELVPTEELALLELIKNSYDSGAAAVSITVQPATLKIPGYIDVRDDGSGMSLEELGRTFMMAGFSERPDQLLIAKRIPTGEKGIGRFATDKLGVELEVITKRKGDTAATVLRVNWDEFKDKRKRFDQVEAKYVTEVLPGWPRARHGTQLRITRLRSRWTQTLLRRARRALEELLDPYKPPANFSIDLDCIGFSSLSGTIQPSRPRHPDIELRFKVLENGSVERRVLPARNGGPRLTRLPAAERRAGLARLGGRLLYWTDRPTKDQLQSQTPGVRLYRDGFRIEPFGSPTADWLGIAAHRAKRAGHAHVVPTRLLGFVEISRVTHPALQDTTSRQALMGNEDVVELVDLLRNELSALDDEIRVRRAEPRWKESRERRATEFEQSRLQTLAIMSYGLAHELRQPLQIIRTEADFIGERLGALTLDAEDLAAARRAIVENIERIDDTIKLLAEISTADVSHVETFNLSDTLRALAKHFRSRGNASGIELVIDAPASYSVRFSKAAIQQIIANLLVNAIDALSDVERTAKRITIEVAAGRRQHIVRVIDNGPGVPPDVAARLFNSFVTKRTGGMGIGLYFSKRLALALGSDLTYLTRDGTGSAFALTFSDKPEAA